MSGFARFVVNFPVKEGLVFPRYRLVCHDDGEALLGARVWAVLQQSAKAIVYEALVLSPFPPRLLDVMWNTRYMHGCIEDTEGSKAFLIA